MKASIAMNFRPTVVALVVLFFGTALVSPAGAADRADRVNRQDRDRVPSPPAAKEPTAPPKLPVLARAKFNPADATNASGSNRTGAAATINGFKADGQGLGVLYWTLRNESAQSLGPGSFAAAERWGESVISPSGVRIVYEGQRHATLFWEQYCLCYRTPPGIDYSSVDTGEEILLTQVFVISPHVTKVTVEIPAFHPVPNIPVQR